MLARLRKAMKTIRAAKSRPAVIAGGLRPALDELESGLDEAVNAIETLAAAAYIIGRGTECPREVLEQLRAIADPEKLT